ncbi:MAG: type I restriction enzyme HsdR N-terminal domain-containing protein [Verrucomicrobia bacterium]|nr:type I restriction enzyme HsdR N-terminal domain-containing protein [Verrucomicrobiota bacterium]
MAATPEEAVRQALIGKLIHLGFPKGLIAVEKGIEADRRFDLLCYYRADELKPLLLIECKAHSLNVEAENQLFGYNAKLGAPFVCLANGSETRLLWREQGRTASVPFIPPYAQLIEKLCL